MDLFFFEIFIDKCMRINFVLLCYRYNTAIQQMGFTFLVNLNKTSLSTNSHTCQMHKHLKTHSFLKLDSNLD